jgi:hypothetical protein
VLVEHRERGVRLERRASGEELVEHAAQRVHVRGRARGAAQGALGREVEAGADDLPGGGERGAGVVEEAGDAEAADFQSAVGVQQQVGGLDVPVHDALPVRGGQPGGGFGGGTGHPLGGQRTSGGKQPGDAVAFDQLHHQEHPVLIRAEVEHVDHMRVAEPAGGLRLQPEPRGGGGVGDLGEQELHGQRSAERLVEAPPHLPHRSPPVQPPATGATNPGKP